MAPLTFTSVTSLAVTNNIGNTVDIGAATSSLAQTFGSSLTNGTAAGQADTGWWDYRPLAASTSEQLNLVGTLTNAFGATATFARIKLLVVSAAPTNANNVVVGGAGSNAVSTLFGSTTHTAIVRPGATLAWIAGNADATAYVVTPTTAMNLQIANGGAGTAINYTVIIVGASV